jgi:hypothetical protein
MATRLQAGAGVVASPVLRDDSLRRSGSARARPTLILPGAARPTDKIGQQASFEGARHAPPIPWKPAFVRVGRHP